MKSRSINPLAAAIGASLLASTLSPLASADSNPFVLSELTAGYQLAQGETAKPAEGKCGEGKCGDAKPIEGKCGAEGKCGENKPDGAEG